jgi:hypothetical protein
MNRTAVEKSRHRLRVQRRRHHYQAEVRTGQPRLLGEREREISVQTTFVEFVEDDGVKF